MNKTTVLFLCTHNSCRSQMAEGLCQSLKNSTIRAYSAGTETREVDALAIQVMSEANIDISEQYSKTIDEYKDIKFDYIFTLCKSAKKKCPFFPSENLIHVGFSDPSAVDKSSLTHDEIIDRYRYVRDEITCFIENIEDFFI